MYKYLNKMFCFQCQETAGCKGCTQAGVCGKTAVTANLQDLLLYVSKGIAEVASKLEQAGKAIPYPVRRRVTEN